MGLDVSLYTKAEREQDDRHDEEWGALWERKERGEVTDEQYEELREAITPWSPRKDRPSERYPDHLFNRRYLRSSYNDGGFNRAVPDFLGDESATLYGIFEPVWSADHDPLVEVAVVEDEAERGEPGGWIDRRHLPALRAARQRALEIAERLRASDRLRVLTVSPHQFGGAEFLKVDDDAALRVYREHIQERGSDLGGWYGTRGLDYVFGDGGATFLAAISGATNRFFSDDPWPAVHLIYRAEGDGFDSYVQSAEITAEFCDEAIELIERDGSAYVSWSG